ncbi:MAG: acetyl-coenzyme A synthetase, partial [Candidatus Parabeggiatoa sp. nov. 1]
MSDVKVYDVFPEIAAKAHITDEKYQDMYARSVSDPDGFWAEQAKEFVTWFKDWDKVQGGSYTEGKIRWFEGGKLNVAYNCIDRHLETRGDQIAILWE